MNEDNRKWWVLAAMATSISMIFIDMTVLPVVLPTLQREMRISDLGLQWIINAYTLSLAVFVLAGGKLGDILGLRKTFCLGVLIFAISSALCGISTSESELIFNRVLQGIGGALLMPATQGILLHHFPPYQRGKALGLFASIGSIFLSVGPLVGGSLTSYLSWHYVFWINLPIALSGLLLTLYAVPKMHGSKQSFDVRGFLILSLGIGSLVFALMQAQKWGWASLATISLISLGVFCLIALFLRKHKPHASILDFNLMKKKSFVSGSTFIFSNQLIIMVTVFWAIYFQNILGFSPSKAGAYSFMANIPVLFAAPLGGYLVDKFGPRLPVMSGFGLIFFSLSWFVLFCRHENIWLLMPTLFTFGFGVSMIFTPSFVTIMNAVPAEKRGIASGMTASIRQFSSSLGLALFGALYSSIYLKHLNKFLEESPSTQLLSPTELEGILSRSPAATQHLETLSNSNAASVIKAAKISFVNGFSAVNLTGALIALGSIGLAWLLLGNKPIHQKK